MPSPRRIKLFSVLIFIFIIFVLFFSGSLRRQRVQDSRTLGDFYSKTLNALDKKTGSVLGEDTEVVVGSGSGSEPGSQQSKGMQDRLNEAARVAKGNANAKAPKPDPPSAVIGVGSAADGATGERSVAGRKLYGGDVKEGGQKALGEEESEEEHEVEVELNAILKKSPIIIFSKTTCPHSKRAKSILLDKYSITPPPYVVELNEHSMGARLQARLGELTDRKTVPNILINGVSIGGGDEIASLHLTKTLIEKFKDLGAKKITKMEVKEVETIQHGLR